MLNLEGPSFIGVGPEKTGTTWIDRQLRVHSQVWMPPIKELRYFWEKENFPEESFWQRLDTAKSWHREQYKKYAKLRLKAAIKHPINTLTSERDRLCWDLKYIFSKHDDEWYKSSFKYATKEVRGEISPQYFFFKEEHIKDISNLVPKAKIIVSLRRPVDWIWSFARMHIRHGIIESKFGSLDGFINMKLETCHFTRSLEAWRRHFSEDQVLVMIYDDLVNDPWAYYARICDFIGIVPDESRRPELAERVYSGSNKEEIPDEVEEKVRSGWREDMKSLAEILPDVPDSWLA